MIWTKNKAHGKVYDVVNVTRVNDKRLINPLVCHQSHMFVSYATKDGTNCEKLLFDELFYYAFKKGSVCQVMIDDSGVLHYHPNSQHS
ncbi:hypothetical protein ACSLBF_07280 [Pseudoalteromonas sp. T1lg65]|uniref:hypothetical protein n=1 Tax=Pseudoalteromonas sp. T1lg65 TaxID=2077101 RepID=UPI003F7ABD11